LGFQAKPLRWKEYDIHLPGWADSHGANWLVAPAKEQLTLIADSGFHGFPFVECLELACQTSVCHDPGKWQAASLLPGGACARPPAEFWKLGRVLTLSL
jgi:hypothetical protein